MFSRTRPSHLFAVATLDEYAAEFEAATVCCLHGLRQTPSTAGLQRLYRVFEGHGLLQHLYPVVDLHWSIMKGLQHAQDAVTAVQFERTRAELRRLRSAHRDSVAWARTRLAEPAAPASGLLRWRRRPTAAR